MTGKSGSITLRGKIFARQSSPTHKINVHRADAGDLDCKDKEWVHVFVDGGGNCGPGSLGVVVVHDGMVIITHGQYIGDKSTNNIAELNAIWKGLRLVKHLNLPVKIYSDSIYALRSICQIYNGRGPKNRELITNIINYLALYPHTVEFVKVKGHGDVRFNNYADSVASWMLSEEKQNGKHKRKKSQENFQVIWIRNAYH